MLLLSLLFVGLWPWHYVRIITTAVPILGGPAFCYVFLPLNSLPFVQMCCSSDWYTAHQLCLEHYGNSEILKDFPITSLPGLCLCNHKRKCTLCVQLKSRHTNHFLATAWERTHPMIGPHVGCRLRASAPRKILPPCPLPRPNHVSKGPAHHLAPKLW